MTWEAEITSLRPFATPPSAEVSIDGDALTVRRGGGAAQRFGLGSSSDVKVTRHQWHLDDGTAIKIRSGNDGVSIGGRGAFFPDLPYERAVVDKPELVMAGRALEELHAALVRALSEGSQAAPRSATHRFLLWKIGDDFRTNALVSCGVIVVGGGSTQLPVPFVIHVALALLLIAGAVWLIAKSERAAKLPALALTIDRDLVTVDWIRPTTSTLVSGPLAAGSIEHGHWSPNRGRATGAPFDNPMVRLSLGSGPGRQLSIGSPRPWAGTRGPRRRRPDYLVASAWWPAFVEAATSAARARS